MAENVPKKPFWNRKTYCIVTGASQGIGRQIALDFCRHVANQSCFLLLARNLENLNETKRLMEQANSSIKVFAHNANLSEPIGVELHKLIGLSLTVFTAEAGDFELALVVHNAGSLGDVTEPVIEMRNIEKINAYLTLNLYSVVLLNAEFMKIFEVDQKKVELAFLNITSLCGVKAFPSMGYYCIGKSAREMYFAVLAEENKDLTVLSYSPGPVYTDMTNEIIDNVQDDGVKNSFVSMKSESKLLSPAQTVGKLVAVLGERRYVNGGRKDYFDEP